MTEARHTEQLEQAANTTPKRTYAQIGGQPCGAISIKAEPRLPTTARRAGDAGERARLWLVVCVLASVVFLVIRGFEFTTLNVSWYNNAYGSVVWLLLGLHTTHLITDTIDTAVLAVLLFTGPLEGKRFVDVSENALYWYFVVLSWLPIYAVIYWAARY